MTPLCSAEWKAMGSPCALKLYGASDEASRAGVEIAKVEVERLEAKYSRYREDSLTSQINASAGSEEGISVDEETAVLLDYADTSFRESGGLFDITSGILRKVWDFRSGKLPERKQIDELMPLVGWQRVRWEKPRLVLEKAGMELDFGGYVKEYAADRVASLCRQAGIRHGLVDLGGDLAVIGPHPDGSPWRVGIRDPQASRESVANIELYRGGLASSGDYERCMVVDGERYAHILSPKTGWPVRSLAAVSVVADQCLVAGTVSTVAMLKGEQDGSTWLSELGLPSLCVTQAGELRGQLAPGT